MLWQVALRGASRISCSCQRQLYKDSRGAFLANSARSERLLKHRSHASRVEATAASSQMSVTPVKDAMLEKLTASLSPTRLDIVDESSQHAGHAAMKGLAASETHFRVTVVSQEFEGLTSVKRHKLVYQALKDQLAGPVHALALRTKTPAEESAAS